MLCDVEQFASTKARSFLNRGFQQSLSDLYKRQSNKEVKHSTHHFISPCGLPKEMGLLGSEGSLTPCLLMEHTLKRYCSPLTRSNTGNRGDVTSTSRLAGFQLLVTTEVWEMNTQAFFRGKQHWEDIGDYRGVPQFMRAVYSVSFIIKVEVK